MDQVKVDKIRDQSLKEIQFARTFKQGKTANWRLNEEMYYAAKKITLESRSSVQLSRMQEFVHTLLSKVDNPLVFKFTKRKNSQTKRVNRLNALRQFDQDQDNWDIKDLVGKKQGIMYGRAIYLYYADSIKGRYRSHLENVDVYDFLIDPSCGGIDMEPAMYLGAYSVILTKKDLEDGIKSGKFIRETTERLVEGNGNANSPTQEQTNKQYRAYDQDTIGRKEGESKDKYRFWRWFTTFEGERYYLLMTDAGDVIRCDLMKDVLPTTEDYKEGMWPFWSWAAFPDLTEFWTPSYCDYVRELFMAQDVSVNQLLDNSESINKPQKAVDTGAVANLAELKYRRDGIIKMKPGTDINKAIQILETPEIDTPLKVFQLLESIQEKASGVTSQSKGVEDVQGKVGIYEGNQAAAADRFGLLNKSYSFGYKRFARLYELGVRDNLVRKVAIEITGPNGVELEEIKRSDIFKKGDSFGLMVEASNAETIASEQAKQAKTAFLASQVQNPAINQKKAVEMQAEIAGFTQEQIDELLDTSVYGNSEQISDADADIESILNGEEVRPNRKANNAYKQHIVNYMNNHDKNLTMEEFTKLTAYLDSLTEVIMRNEARALQEQQNKRLMAQAQMPPEPGAMPPQADPGAPPSPVPQMGAQPQPTNIPQP